MAAMLTGERVLGPSLSHQVTRIEWQTLDKGWLLDDLLLSLRDGSSEGSLALSTKSNHQINRAGFFKDFVQAIWTHWHQKETGVFEKDRDFLGLAVARLDSEVEDAWNDLLQAVLRSDDPDRVAQRITGARRSSNKLTRQLFESLHCPPILGASDPAETVRLIGRLRVLFLDFRNEPSRSAQQARRMCQEAVEGHDPAAAEILWARLIALSLERNPAGGSLLSLLLALRADFLLLAPLDDRADWQRLERFSQAGLARTRDSLASGLVIPRSEASGEIQAQLVQRRSVLISGESGAGKSALAKSIGRSWQSGSVVWLDPVGAEAEDLIALERKIGLRKPLDSLLPLNPRKLSLLVLDALERWSVGGLDCAARLIDACSRTEAWVIMATNRTDEQRWVLDQLSSRGVPADLWSFHPLDLPSRDDLGEVWRRFPDLHRVPLRHSGMEGILRNLKVLDWLTRRRTGETASWATPSQLIDGLWQRWTGISSNPYGRSNTLQKIARLEAELMEASVAVSSLEGSETVLRELERDELIRIEDERISFRHDLIGDWARLRSLVAESPGTLRQKLPELALSPHWYSALRFFGQRLLEQGDSGAQRWLDLYEALPEAVDSSTVARDLLLDSLIFASNSEQHLERLWPHLVARNGHLLNRLLNRFLFVATKPHPRIAAWRLPYRHWPLWGPILETLDHHRSDVATKAPVRGAEVAGLWLELAPQDWRWRREAARVALEIANAHPDSETALIFEAALRAAPELPDEVSELALRLSRRRGTPLVAEDHEEPEEDLVILHPRAGRLRPPYPDGPLERVGRGFQKAVLSSGALKDLITVRPETAREVLLACCLQEPRWVSPDRDRYFRDVPGLYEWMEGFPPSYSSGPFLRFLELQPKEGLEVILRLVNQATANWEAEANRKTRRDSLVIKRRRWVGDEDVYRWNEHSSNVLVSALAALEKWLEDELRAGRSVEPAIRTIFKRSRSAAFAAVLVGLGKKRPELFEDPLLPLLRVWQLYRWDHFTGLLWLAIQLVLSRRFEDAFAGFRHTWAGKLRSADFVDRDDIQRLSARLDPGNYPDGAAASFEWPEPLREPSERGLAAVLPSIHASTLAHECHRLLEKAETLELTQAEALWSKLLGIESTKERLRPEQYADAMTGAIAALLLLPGEWGREHPDQRDECKRLYFGIFAEIPPADHMPHSAELLKEHWPGFAAETAVALLAEDPTDPRVRRLMAMAIMSRWHETETTAIAMTRGFLDRHRLGEDWGRMQNLAGLWTALNSMGYGLREDSLPHRWATRLTGWFVQAKLPSRLLDWKKISQVSLSLRARFHRKEVATLEDRWAHPWFRPVDLISSGFNRHDLRAAFSWLPRWEPASTRERDEWLELHRRLLYVAVGPCLAVAQLTQNERRREGLMSEYATWVLGRIAALIPQLPTPADRRSFWDPLFSPGEVARDLVASFLGDWFYFGPPSAENPDHFVRCWEEIIHYAASENNGSVGDDEWNFLMGLHWQGPAQYRAAVGRLLPLYQSWAEKHLTGARTANQFARFLGTPAAFDLVPSGIAWLAAALPTFRDSNESSLDEAIVDLLRAAWKRAALSPALRSPIQELLAWAVQRATPAALALQEEIRR